MDALLQISVLNLIWAHRILARKQSFWQSRNRLWLAVQLSCCDCLQLSHSGAQTVVSSSYRMDSSENIISDSLKDSGLSNCECSLLWLFQNISWRLFYCNFAASLFHMSEELSCEYVWESKRSLSCRQEVAKQDFCFFFLSQNRGYPTLTASFPWHVRTQNPCQSQFTPLWHYLLPTVSGQVSVPACIRHSQHIKSWVLSISFCVFR